MNAASDIIDALIPIVDPEKKTHVKLNYALTALSFGISFIPVVGPEFSELSTLTIDAANLALDGIKKAPDVAKSLWPAGTQDTQDEQISILRGSIPYLELRLLESLGEGLGLVQGVNQNNTSAFLAFASGGGFSRSDVRSLPKDSSVSVGGLSSVIIQPLLLAFTTYLVSTALAQNGWYILQVPGNFHDFA